MANTMKALQTVTVGAGGAASISFTSIPQTYTDLVIKTSIRNDRSTSTGYPTLTFNGSSSGYLNRELYGTGSVAGSGTAGGLTTAIQFYADGAGATASTFANNEIYIPNYVSSNYKSVSIDSVNENNATAAGQLLLAGLWSNTSPITSITISAGDSATVLSQYSTFTLYGVFNQDVIAAPAAPTIGTATAGDASASITFTGVSGAASYTMTSSPGSVTATGVSSPITVSGLTNGTAYTFTCKANNPIGTGAASAASNSVTPELPGDYISIATASGTGSSDTITFSSIPQIYTHLQIRIFAKGANTGNGVGTGSAMVFNGDTTSTNYWRQGINAYGSGIGANNSNDNALWDIIGSASGTANMYATNVIDILDYTSTSKVKVVRSIVGENTNGNGAHLGPRSGMWNNTAAITSISLQSFAGNFLTPSHIALYGIKG